MMPASVVEALKEKWDTEDRQALRDQFAMAALTGLMSNELCPDAGVDESRIWLGKTAYQLADAMLEAR